MFDRVGERPSHWWMKIICLLYSAGQVVVTNFCTPLSRLWGSHRYCYFSCKIAPLY